MENGQIFFKKQLWGKWRRTENGISKHVGEEDMFDEIQRLVDEGWQVVPHGVTYVRAITVIPR
jgi:hypothetical protein